MTARVLLVEEGWSQTLELARGLEAGGHRVTVATANGSTASYRRRTVDWLSAPPVACARFVPGLDRLIEERGIERVVPLTEAVMRRLWAARPAWNDRIFPATEPWQRAVIADKHRLVEYMAACGIAVPRQIRIGGAFDPAMAARVLGLPAIVKEATGVAGTRVRIVESERDLARVVARARASGGSWVVQEYVEGQTCLFGGVFHDGRALRIYAGEKLELYPPRVGPAIRIRSDDHEALVATGQRVFGELRWTGLASVDFIRRRDGSYVLLEVNPRPWGSLAAARAAGVDLVGAFGALLAGEIPRTDLSFGRDRECMIFPRYLLAPRYRNLAGARRALRDLFGPQGRDWRHPGFLRHIVRRLLLLEERALGDV